MRPFFAVAAGVALTSVATAALSMPAQAESVVTVPLPCMTTDEFEAFKNKHGEGTVAFGVTSTGALVQRIESADGGWTLILQIQNRLYCALAAGEGWHAKEKPFPSGPDT